MKVGNWPPCPLTTCGHWLLPSLPRFLFLFFQMKWPLCFQNTSSYYINNRNARQSLEIWLHMAGNTKSFFEYKRLWKFMENISHSWLSALPTNWVGLIYSIQIEAKLRYHGSLKIMCKVQSVFLKEYIKIDNNMSIFFLIYWIGTWHFLYGHAFCAPN